MSIVSFTQELAQKYFDSTEEFPVNFSDAWQWLDYSRKDSAKRTFLGLGFIESIDFQVFHINVECADNKGFSRREDIRLTCDCLKQWGMMAGTDKGKEIRLYFLECEKIAKSKAIQPVSTADLLVQMALAYKEHEIRLAAIEKENIALKKQLAEVHENQEVLELETQANTCELERFRNGHGYWYSIIGFAAKHNIKDISTTDARKLGRKAASLCRLSGIVPQKINDPRYGNVGTYPQHILEELIFGQPLTA